ncbi:MAG TPA: hypothetical protein VMN78_02880 [Longimicrobiales bacterium]|nr:hypothetical protein [Longimicrobiales bacterium]
MALVLVALAGAAPLGAQDAANPLEAQEAATPLQAGDLLRIRYQGETLVGVAYEATDDTVRITTTNGTVGVPLSPNLRIERSLGRRSRLSGAARGAGKGLLAGAGGGAVLGFASGDDPTSLLSFTAEEKALLAGTLLGVSGVAVGGIIGLIVPGQRWEHTPLDGVQAALYPTEGGVGIAIQLPTR